MRAAGGLNSTERPKDRSDVARVYAAVTPVLIFNPVVRGATQGKSLTETARALALLNMAISDAAVATFDTKYHYKLWRPETAIRAGDMDGNPKTEPDALFAPLIPAPCFPSYPSAHATLSNALAR